jgi:hypothetical protein
VKALVTAFNYRLKAALIDNVDIAQLLEELSDQLSKEERDLSNRKNGEIVRQKINEGLIIFLEELETVRSASF